METQELLPEGSVLDMQQEEAGRRAFWVRKLVYLGIIVVIALVSFFPAAQIASSADTYTGAMETLDEKKANVAALMASTTASSVAVSLIPGDAGTPIANKLVDLSSDFLIILSVIYLEKFLLTTLGYAAFTFLIPAACILLAVALFLRDESRLKDGLRNLATKLAVFGLAITFVIPASVWLSDSIDDSFQASLEAANASTEEATQSIQESTQQTDEGDQDLFSSIASAAQDGIDSITQGAQDALDALGQSLNTIVDTLAIMIVTSCLIPIAVLAFCFWLVNAITGLNIGSSRRVFQSGKQHVRTVAGELKK